MENQMRVVLRAILKLYKLVIRLPDKSTPSEIRNNPRFYPYFKDCIEALDETHVPASIPLSIQGRFRSRKGETTQSVLAAITFDLKFSYVLAGWEGSAHDSRILSNALSSPRGLKFRKAHNKYEPLLNKSIDHYDEMALVVGRDMATGIFAKTFADINLDDGN
ncbi:uncharacterized protein LOC108477913 [Gossypium arboreum]|uniref:uncharacterized protein LOC108477913 n=1 Tax=Gossypium arboreum TaxID=29729 RepID=UPI0008195F68|nr:uncharacterized protein LOC108477913 [Gossypium arboreum]